MKKFLAVLLVITLLFMFFSIPAFARAGGGGGGGSGSGGGSYRYGYGYRHRSSGYIISRLLICIGAGISALFLYFKIIRSYLRTRKLMKLLSNKDSAWKYEGVMKRVKKAYFIIQDSWSSGDMKHARSYMSESLFNEFQDKLAIMKRDGERNVLEKVKLKDVMPISLHDSKDDSFDMIWFRIKGSMLDYKINSETKKPLPHETYKGNFIEYWQFIRNQQGEWVLNRILQKDEIGNIQLDQ